MRLLISAMFYLLAIFSSLTLDAQERRARPSSQASAAATSVVVLNSRPETQLEKVSAEALDICLRIYRRYGFVEIKAAVGGNGQPIVVCQ